MEEDEYRATYHEINKTRCAFEKAILSRRCSCPHAHKFCLAEREGIACQEISQQQHCQHFLGLARLKSQFSLKLPQLAEKLPHAKEMRLQLGSLSGLATLLDCDSATKIEDISQLLTSAQDSYPDFDALPFDPIIRAITHQEVRRRRRKRTS